MDLFGRDTVLGQLRLSSAPLTLLVGDSGVGKSEVLRGLDSGWPEGTLVPGARLLGSPPGSLQSAITDELGEALSLFSNLHPSPLKDIRDGLIRLLDRAAAATAGEVSKLLMARVLRSVQGKFGDEVADLVRDVAPELFSKDGNPMADRLSELSRSDTASELMAIAEDIGSMMDARVVIRLDQGEVLGEDDLSLLGELASRSVHTVQLYATFSNADPDTDRALARLEARGAARLTLLGLDRPGLEAWFKAESVPHEAWAPIDRVSNGYPFFVRDAIALANAGTSIESLATPGGFESLLRLRWNSLDPRIQALGLQLSAFRDPPDEDFLQTYLSIGPHEWATLRSSLRMAGVFVERPDGTIWFHDRRRNYIWISLMDERLRETTSKSVLKSLDTWQATQTHISPWVIGSLLPLVSAAVLDETFDTPLRKLLLLDRAELSVLFALIEVVEPAGDRGQFADTGELVAYATSKFGEPLNPVQTLESLREKGLVVVASNERASLTCLVVSGALTYPTLLAVLDERMGRMPVPKFASTMFDYSLRPILGAFSSASISLGEGSLRHHRFALLELQKQEAQQRSILRSLPGLGVVAKVEGQSFTCSVLFESVNDRQKSVDRLREFQTVVGGPFAPVIESVVELPPAKVPSARYTELQKLANQTAKVSVARPEQLREVLRRRVAILEVFRRHMSETEASAFGMRHPKRLLVDFAENTAHLSWTEFIVSGPGTQVGVELIDVVNRVDPLHDPLVELKLRRDGLIAPTERIEGWTIHASMPFEVEDPLTASVKLLTERAREFNRSLESVRVAPNSNEIRAAIQAERDVQVAILRDLQTEELADVDGKELSFSIRLELWPQNDLAWGFGWLARQLDIDDGLSRVEVVLLEEPPPEMNLWEGSESERTVARLGGVPIMRSTSGMANSIVGELMGLGMSDFHIWEPDMKLRFGGQL